jgi:hypothetical protein
MARFRSAVVAPSGVAVPRTQLELFPRARTVERLEPREVVGPETRVTALYRVRYEGTHAVHLVFVDKHGWYCGDHGRHCDAVAAARGVE